MLNKTSELQLLLVGIQSKLKCLVDRDNSSINKASSHGPSDALAMQRVATCQAQNT